MNWVDLERGTVDRAIYADEDIYREELRKIFGRAWNFMCHESQIDEPGKFFLNYIGEDQVIAVRDRNRDIQVLLNTCPHRGNTVCRAEQGRMKSFFCSYHGWNFDLDGRLLAVPGEEAYYRDGLDKDTWGLFKAAQVESYKGFVFATLDPDAPSLSDYLGWVGRLGLDMIAERGEIEVVDGIQKNRIKCNWKLAVDNLFDWYHPKVSHVSGIRAGLMKEEDLYPMSQMVLLGELGHAIGGPGVREADYKELEKKYRDASSSAGTAEERRQYAFAWRADPKITAEMGPVGVRSRGHPLIFPNIWVALSGTQICLRLPKGLGETELWWFTFAEKSMSKEQRRNLVQSAIHVFGPAGILEQDDGENWSHSTRGTRTMATKGRPLNFSMGLGKDEMVEDPSGQSAIETVVNEHGQLWAYRNWQEWMQAESWQELMENHSAVPVGRV